jgi:hypothetical protein
VKRMFVPLCLALALTGCRGATGASSMPAVPVGADSATGLRAPSAKASLVVSPGAVGAAESSAILGANMATWYDITKPGLAASFEATGMKSLRWPGGSESDNFHWQTDSLGSGACSGGYAYPPSTTDALISGIATPAKMDVAITVNYGSNPGCTGGAEPSEAAGWVKYANDTKHYGITWWTVGNEEFGSWETDKHTQPHDPAQYASLVATQFYPQMKAASSTAIKVGVDVDPGYSAWDSTVLSQAKYDFVELHYYPQGNTVSDSFIVDQGAPQLAQTIEELKTEMKNAGHPNTPIYVGEIGSTYGTPGKQTTSITQALYAGQVIGEMAREGVARATWWIGYGGCDSQSEGGDFDASLYGWQDFGGYMMFSDGTQQESCSSTNVPTGTILPTARAYQVASHFVRNGEHIVASKLAGLPNVRAYAGTYGGGIALMLFNIDKNAPATVPVTIAKKASGKGGFVWTYDKTIYDKSKNDVWAAPVRTKLKAWSKGFSVTLPPWSMVVVQTK